MFSDDFWSDRPYRPAYERLVRAWEAYYLARGVAVGRAGGLARVKAQKNRPVPA